MQIFRKVTIGKKIILTSVFAMLGMLTISGISLVFFGQIGDIGQLTNKGSQYRIRVYRTSLAFERYVRTQRPEDFKAYSQEADSVYEMDVVPGEVYRLIQKYDDLEQVQKEYKRIHGVVHPDVANIFKLFSDLKGKPQLRELVRYTDAAHEIANQKRQLADSFTQVEDSRKRGILEEIHILNQQHHETVDKYLTVLADLADYIKGMIFNLFFAIALTMVVIMALLSFFVIRSIKRPLGLTVSFAKELSKGDLTQKVDIINRDELGNLGDSLNQMSDDLGDMLREIKQGVQTLTEASDELSGLSTQMLGDTNKTASQSDGVAAAARNMSENMNGVASAVNQASTNANIVASAAEEMSSTINEIAKEAESARTISVDANEKTQQATVMMNELELSAKAIDKVVVTITDISEQVNLLALNATIEAARAGESGKGFAVVAGEIKDLAQQTAAATQDIKSQISTIQKTAATTISHNREISTVIENVNGVITTIASAVEEQSSATREIVNNVVQLSTGFEEISRNISEATGEADSINQSLTEVNQSTAQIETSNSMVKQRSDELSTLAEQIDSMVSRFKL